MVPHRYSELGRSLGILDDVLPWYWNLFIYSSPWLLMAGFVMLPLAMDGQNPDIHANRTAIKVMPFILIGIGYLFCAVCCIRWRKCDVLQDLLLIPFFGSSLVGLLNVTLNIAVRQLYPLDGLSITAIVISCISVVGYGSAALYNSQIENYIPGFLKTRRRFGDNGTDDAELQRRQLLRLYLKKDGDRAPSTEVSRSTFRLDLPDAREPSQRGEEMVLAPPKNTYEWQLPPAAPPNDYNPIVMHDVQSPNQPPVSSHAASSSRHTHSTSKSWYSQRPGRDGRRMAELGDL